MPWGLAESSSRTIANVASEVKQIDAMDGQISASVLLHCGMWVLCQQQLYGFKAAIAIAHAQRHRVKRQISIFVLLLCGRWICVEDGPKGRQCIFPFCIPSNKVQWQITELILLL
jgi:hypothetical protein